MRRTSFRKSRKQWNRRDMIVMKVAQQNDIDRVCSELGLHCLRVMRERAPIFGSAAFNPYKSDVAVAVIDC